MSNAPYLLNSARWGQRLTHGEMTDSLWELLHSGSGLLGEKFIMGQTAENLAVKYSITRREQDEVALRSHNNAEAAATEGRFEDEIVPVAIKTRKGVTTVDRDEHTRYGLVMDDLVGLKPAFDKKDGTVTAGNSSGLNDGAAAAVLMTRAKATELDIAPLARVDPRIMGYGPVPAIEKLLARTGMKLDQIDLFEINEAFAAQYIACEKGLGLERDKVNVNGSGIGLGHPVGCTGLRIVISLMNEMRRRDEQYGVASLCVGGGLGMETLFELE